jgi:hypothetical protein
MITVGVRVRITVGVRDRITVGVRVRITVGVRVRVKVTFQMLRSQPQTQAVPSKATAARTNFPREACCIVLCLSCHTTVTPRIPAGMRPNSHIATKSV